MNNQIEVSEKPLVWVEKGELAYWADTAINVEKVRVASQLRLTSIQKLAGTSPDTEEFIERVKVAEDFADSRMATLIVLHPTWPWAERIKGIGKENYPKPVGLIEKFGKFYDVGDPLIPLHVQRAPQEYQAVMKGKVVEKTGIWVAGIERLTKPSKLWKYAGLHVEDGAAPKRTRGKLLGFNSELRSMLIGRLAPSLLRLKNLNGIWYQEYAGIREELVAKAERDGIKLISTPSERVCPECNTAVQARATRFCPECGTKLTVKKEPPGTLFLGHLHQRAVREMMKRFTVCMWIVWREALGLPITQPYSVEFLDHKPIDPWKMVDR